MCCHKAGSTVLWHSIGAQVDPWACQSRRGTPRLAIAKSCSAVLFNSVSGSSSSSSAGSMYQGTISARLACGSFVAEVQTCQLLHAVMGWGVSCCCVLFVQVWLGPVWSCCGLECSAGDKPSADGGVLLATYKGREASQVASHIALQRYSYRHRGF
jgi:hypothetical protein